MKLKPARNRVMLRKILPLPNTDLKEVFCDTSQMLCLLHDFANLRVCFLFYFSLNFQDLQVIGAAL